jgi:hypothetical protein
MRHGVLDCWITTSWVSATHRSPAAGRHAPAWFREETMPEEIPEKSFREWLAEALAQDEKTWEALEEKVKTMRVKQGIPDEKKEPRDC